jgi:hypothetical protein
MILTLDNLASRYHVLPSEALARGTTFDLHVMDLSARYVRYQQERAELEQELKSGARGPVVLPTTQEMEAMLARVKETK